LEYPARPGNQRASPKPDTRSDGSCDANTSHGQIWKLGDSSKNFEIHVQDSIFHVEGLSRNGTNTMFLQYKGNITYDNVTVVSGGDSEWPGPDHPPGVTFAKDISIWETARAEWLCWHGCDADGESCTFGQ
jgi:hypothetical protein